MDSSDLLGSLMGQLGGGGIDEIGRSVGLDSGDVSKVLAGAMPAILTGLTRNTSSGSGAAGLLGALDRDHDGSILDDVMGYLGGGGRSRRRRRHPGSRSRRSPGQRRTGDQQIERSRHGFGGQDPGHGGAAADGCARQSETPTGSRRFGLAAALGQQERKAREVSPSAVDMFSRLLDSDGDGDPMDDIVKMGSGLLGGLFKS